MCRTLANQMIIQEMKLLQRVHYAGQIKYVHLKILIQSISELHDLVSLTRYVLQSCADKVQ